MYPISSHKSGLSQETMNFVLSQKFGEASADKESRLRKIADLSYDLLSSIQKTEKLRRLGQLGKSGENEFDSNVRLVGIMMHILRESGYNNLEMMASLEKKYQQLNPGKQGRQV